MQLHIQSRGLRIKSRDTSVKKFMLKESEQPTSLEQFVSFLTSYKTAFDLGACTSWYLSLGCDSHFRKRFIRKKFFKDENSENTPQKIRCPTTKQHSSTTNRRARAEYTDLVIFVDEFNSRHENHKISHCQADFRNFSFFFQCYFSIWCKTLCRLMLVEILCVKSNILRSDFNAILQKIQEHRITVLLLQ